MLRRHAAEGIARLLLTIGPVGLRRVEPRLARDEERAELHEQRLQRVGGRPAPFTHSKKKACLLLPVYLSVCAWQARAEAAGGREAWRLRHTDARARAGARPGGAPSGRREQLDADGASDGHVARMEGEAGPDDTHKGRLLEWPKAVESATPEAASSSFPYICICIYMCVCVCVCVCGD